MENNIEKIINKALKEAATTEVVKETVLEESKIQRLKAGDTITINKKFPYFSSIKNPVGKVKKIGNIGAQVTLDGKTYEVRDGEFKHTGVVTEADANDTSTKADETFKTLEAVLLDLRNAESKLVMGISYDMQNLFGGDLNAIKAVIENASASVENLAKKMHQTLLQEGEEKEELKNLSNSRKLNW